MERKVFRIPKLALGPALSLIFVSTLLLITLPELALAVDRSHFFADDFYWASDARSNMSEIFSPTHSDGRPLSNILYWFFATEIFGFSSSIPYVVTNLALILTGLYFWAVILFKLSFSFLNIAIITVLIMFSAPLYGTVFWASNVTHSLSFLILPISIGRIIEISAHPAKTTRIRIFLTYVLLSSICLINPQLNFTVLTATVFTTFVICKNKQAEVGSGFILACISLPVIAIAFASLGVLKKSSYGISIKAIHSNLVHYNESFTLSNGWLQLTVVAIITISILHVIREALKKRFFPLAILIVGVTSFMPALVQPDQRAIQYALIPLLSVAILFIDFLANLDLLESLSNYASLQKLFNVSGVAALGSLLFVGGNDVRSYFAQSPPGSHISNISASFTNESESICLVTDTLEKSNLLNAQTSGARAFMPPFAQTNSARIVSDQNSCLGRENIYFLGQNIDGTWNVTMGALTHATDAESS